MSKIPLFPNISAILASLLGVGNLAGYTLRYDLGITDPNKNPEGSTGYFDHLTIQNRDNSGIEIAYGTFDDSQVQEKYIYWRQIFNGEYNVVWKRITCTRITT